MISDDLIAADYVAETWAGVAKLVARSARWCRYAAQLPEDRLPVYRARGVVCLRAGDFADWFARHGDEYPPIRPARKGTTGP